ncbi:copper chaperone PCu(A)C [Jannaschia sp. LMIT008]|uniref:copper chaperone PCu(A)C n=1 Tax=Jannaschia maritima TaxID=3032585 RepID=UPI002810A4AE|nr:copper chaperone PCu(A)C [Jannaschia sp. LMIT008]
MRLATIVLAAALAPLAATAEDGHDDHLAELDGLRAVHAWTRATDATETLIFVEIQNEGEVAVTLEGAHADGLDATLVGFRLQDGSPVYEPVDAVPVAPGRELHLEPDGLAIRLTGLSTPLAEGEEMEMELVTSLGEIEIHVEVEAADAIAHSHAGHNH